MHVESVSGLICIIQLHVYDLMYMYVLGTMPEKCERENIDYTFN